MKIPTDSGSVSSGCGVELTVSGSKGGGDGGGSNGSDISGSSGGDGSGGRMRMDEVAAGALVVHVRLDEVEALSGAEAARQGHGSGGRRGLSGGCGSGSGPGAVAVTVTVSGCP